MSCAKPGAALQLVILSPKDLANRDLNFSCRAIASYTLEMTDESALQ